MPSFAVLANNVVTNTIIADTESIAELVTGQKCVEYKENETAGIGSIYDPTTKTFSAPTSEEI